MTVTKTLIGKNEDGSDRFDYDYNGDPDGGLTVTGPISGTVVLADGSVHSLTPEVIEHGPGQKGPILHHIESLHQEAGTFPGFVHACTDACGAERTVS